MRVESKWTPRGVSLWLIAAILAALAVWSQTQPSEEPPESSPAPVEFDVVE